MLRVLSIFGTRPEAIKMAPVVRELRRHREQVVTRVCVTGQHREMLDQVLGLFGIEPDVDLDLMVEDQSLAGFASASLRRLAEVIGDLEPHVVLVQGDTTTAMTGALASHYHRVPVGHVEAGLRSGDRYSPFPEEMNRRLISVLSSLHFAPTQTAAAALQAEGVPSSQVLVTGNTVIDALLWVTQQPASPEARDLLARLDIEGDAGSAATSDVGTGSSQPSGGARLVLVTAHRRENFGQPLREICRALLEIVERNPDVQVVYPVHMNPSVLIPVSEILGGQERIHLVEPLSYESFARLMSHAFVIVTDSGGIQEEAPALGKPVLVLRRETERPEAVESGTAKLVGTERRDIVRETERLLHDPLEYERMAQAVSPYGDGRAAERIVNKLLETLGLEHGHKIG